MKSIILLLFVAIAVQASNEDDDLWQKFKQYYNKTYASDAEEKARFSSFQSNLELIKANNEDYTNGKVSYFFRVTKFADLNDEEFLNLYLRNSHLNQPASQQISKEQYSIPVTEPPTPEAIDWRAEGKVSAVRDQGSCGGGGWAYSVAGAVEAQNAIVHNISSRISAQQFIDCSSMNQACSGGDVISAISEFVDEELFTEKSYTYNVTRDSCGSGVDSGILIHEVFMIIPEEENLQNVVGTRGPVVAGINAVDLRLYGGGIYNNPNCSQEVNHKVLAVGYGSKDGLDYWILENSWGREWGENGYVYLARNKGQQCGIGTENNIPLLR